ncbi:MAG: MBL fold metallo-hydrolase [Dehalococcoidia bacterium]|nr:MBL fold metallo-hydrolase [Dehalococcoidia bacterium]MDW8120488.1 MBL fold metallo-hydrolase [Chloroflexota bacterium]
MQVRILVVGPFATNCYLVSDEESKEALIIDPGGEAQRIVEEVRRLGLQPRLMVSTHGHIDHVAAAAAVKEALGVPYALHPDDIFYLKSPSGLQHLFPDYREPPNPDHPLKGGDTLTFGACSLLVLETPGHTPGSICLYGQGAVFTGDTLFQGSVGRTDFPGGSHARLISSIFTKLLVLPDTTVVLPGHGPRSTIGNEKRWNPFLGGRGV